MTSRILVPVNDQVSALTALECAMARRWPSRSVFLLCTIVEDLTQVPQLSSLQHREILLAEQNEHALQMKEWLKQAIELFQQTFPDAQALMESGTIPEQICSIAKEWSADYILIGSHTFTPRNRLAIKSVAAQVMAHAPCTVEAVRYPTLRNLMLNDEIIEADFIRKAASTPPQRVLVASDLSAPAAGAIDWVADQNWPEGCMVRMICVTAPTRPVRENMTTGDKKVRTYTKENQFLRRLENELRVQAKRIVTKQPQLKLESFLVQADSPAEGIIDQAADWNADLVVTGAQGENRSTASKAGSTAIKIMENIDCSMIAVRQSLLKSVHYSWYDFDSA
jgi:nucleotide-binding universal stress UspA family protein